MVKGIYSIDELDTEKKARLEKWLKASKRWKKYPPSVWMSQSIRCFYQKEIVDDIYANIHEFEIDGKARYELHIQIPEEKSIIGMTINTISFTYNNLDFAVFEKEARIIINKLTKKQNDPKNIFK